MSDNEVVESGDSSIVFVGGKAIEQHIASESNLEADERATAAAAVRKAMDEANAKAKDEAEAVGKEAARLAKAKKSEDPYSAKTKPNKEDKDSEETEESSEPKPKVQANRGADGKFVSPDGATKKPEGKQTQPKGQEDVSEEHEEPINPETASVKQLLKNREKLAQVKRTISDERSQFQQEMANERTRLAQYQAQLQMQQQNLMRQVQAMKELQKDPARMMREFGYDPDQFILDLAQEGTEEGKARRRERELAAEMNRLKAFQENQIRQAQQYRQQQELEAAKTKRLDAVNRFLDLAGNPEKYPEVASFYKGKERQLIAIADIAADEYRRLAGREAPFEDLLDYIEDDLASSFTVRYSSSNGSQARPSENKKGSPPKGVKGKSLSPSMSGDRVTHSQPKLNELDADERKERAKIAVAAAIRAANEDNE